MTAETYTASRFRLLALFQVVSPLLAVIIALLVGGFVYFWRAETTYGATT